MLMWSALAKRIQVVASDPHPRRRTMARTREDLGWETRGPLEMTPGNLTNAKREGGVVWCDVM